MNRRRSFAVVAGTPWKQPKYYVGWLKDGSGLEVITTYTAPTEETHGKFYSRVLGPMTKRAADWFCRHPYNTCRTAKELDDAAVSEGAARV